MHRTTTVMAACATLATVGVLGVGLATAAPAALAQSVTPTGSGAPGMADQATRIDMRIVNNTAETLVLTSATDSGTWQDRASDIAPGATEDVTNYSGGNAKINLTYTGALSKATYTFAAETPLVGKNSGSGSTTNAAYRVDTSIGSGYDPTDTFTINGDQTFTSTGATQTYTVPDGVTQLKVTAVGGAGGAASNPNAPAANGAQIGGTLPVTPGQVLTLGVGGNGNDDSTRSTHAGWGPTIEGQDYSGGDVLPGSTYITGGGGGATVIADQNGNPLVIAGGGGGQGDPESDDQGGSGGYDGQLTGQNGGPAGSGGKAGANSTAQGQSVTTTTDGPSGAGGGGYRGGLAGIVGASQGGGAGSSYAGPLTGMSVQTATAAAGQITIVPATG